MFSVYDLILSDLLLIILIIGCFVVDSFILFFRVLESYFWFSADFRFILIINRHFYHRNPNYSIFFYRFSSDSSFTNFRVIFFSFRVSLLVWFAVLMKLIEIIWGVLGCRSVVLFKNETLTRVSYFSFDWSFCDAAHSSFIMYYARWTV